MIEYRIIRPEGNLIWTAMVPDNAIIEPPYPVGAYYDGPDAEIIGLWRFEYRMLSSRPDGEPGKWWLLSEQTEKGRYWSELQGEEGVMPRPRDLQGETLRNIVALSLYEAMQSEERVFAVKAAQRRLLQREMPRADDVSLEKEVNANYWVKGAVSDNQFHRDKVKMYSAAAAILGPDWTPNP